MKKIHYAWWILVSCCALEFGVVGMTASTMGIYLVPVSETLGVGVGQLSLYVTIQNLVMMALYPLAGKLLMEHEIRLVVSAPVLGISAIFLGLSRATKLLHFYIAGALLGLCYSFLMFLVVPLLINNWFRQRAGSAMGIALAFSGVGGALSSLAVGAIISNWGWRVSYAVTAAGVAIVVLPFTLLVIRRTPVEKGLYAYGAAASGGGTSEAVDSARPALAGTLQPAFAGPLRWCLLALGGMMGLLSAMQSSVSVFASSLGFSTQVGSVASSIIMAAVIAAKLILGSANDRIGVHKTLNIACGISAAAVIFFFASSGSRAGTLFLGAALYGFAVAISVLQPPMLVRTTFGPERYGQIYPKVQQAYSLASAAALPLYNFIYDRLDSYRPVLVLLLAAIAAATLCGTWMRRYSTGLCHERMS